jgi:AcrR family transcriptional regulator
MPPSARSPLTRDRVLRTAVRLADKHGLEALSMRKLAAALKVEAMSLYHHVASKDELLDGMVNLVVGEIELPSATGDWRVAMRRRATSAHAVMMRHPWAPLLLVSRINVGPNMLRYVDATLGCLRAAGFTWLQADRGWHAIDSHIYGFTLHMLSSPITPEDYPAAAAQYLPMLPAAEYPNMHALTTLVAEGKHDGTEDFAFGLELILSGLQQLLKKR